MTYFDDQPDTQPFRDDNAGKYTSRYLLKMTADDASTLTKLSHAHQVNRADLLRAFIRTAATNPEFRTEALNLIAQERRPLIDP